MTSRRDVEADLRAKLAAGAKIFVTLIGRGQTTPEGALDGLVRDAFGSPERLRDAAELLGDEDSEARALLVRAVRYAEDPRAPAPPRVSERPDASRYGGSGASAPAPKGVTSRGGCYSGDNPRPRS